MKNKHSRTFLHMPLVALALATSSAYAGTETVTSAPAPAPATTEDVISGVLKLDFNSHFISYGLDVWGDGSHLSNHPTFNPMLELSFALPANFTATLGTWWDVNSKPGSDTSPIGGQIQEIDVWAGLAYTYEKFTVGVTYQDWNYAGETEEILDVKFAYDCLLSPSLTVHNRLDEGGSGGQTGTVLVLGLSHGFDLGPVAIAFPLNVAYFLEDDFHPGADDDGFGFASLGVTASLPLKFLGDSYGEWSLNGALTYYVTDDGVIPTNPTDHFLTAGLGLSVSF